MNSNINTLDDSNNNQAAPQSVISAYATKTKDVITGLPLFVKFLPIAIIIIYIPSIFFWQMSFYLSNVPLYTFYHIQLWRLFTASLLMTGILNIVFALLFWIPTASIIEKSMGTLRYVLAFAIHSVIIQTLYASVLVVLKLIFGEKMLEVGIIHGSKRVQCNGIWPMIMMDITTLSLEYANNILRLFCFPCQLKVLFYPIILLILFLIFNGLQIDLIVGFVYGIAYYYLLKNRMQLPEAGITKCETSPAFKWLTSIKGYIALNAVTRTELGMRYQEHINDQEQPSASNNLPQGQPQAQTQGRFNAFSGPGTVVG